MITEDYCSFETSKLLKEKGFDFENQNEGVQQLLSLEHNDVYYTITHSLAMKWLRERHDLHIEVIYNLYYKEYKGCMYKNIGEYNYTEFYSTYEEAVEAALKYALENLI